MFLGMWTRRSMCYSARCQSIVSSWSLEHQELRLNAVSCRRPKGCTLQVRQLAGEGGPSKQNSANSAEPPVERAAASSGLYASAAAVVAPHTKNSAQLHNRARERGADHCRSLVLLSIGIGCHFLFPADQKSSPPTDKPLRPTFKDPDLLGQTSISLLSSIFSPVRPPPPSISPYPYPPYPPPVTRNTAVAATIPFETCYTRSQQHSHPHYSCIIFSALSSQVGCR
ncbi:hypothetical protein EDC01DRAFT_349852 [Geopyxis carbonaria]|nr:hypothetical protein EDC01DRAFT_349852 [Geopyxis carbonaria]